MKRKLRKSACNACPCGYLGDGTERCACSATSIVRYYNRLSGPMLDRIDMHIHLPRIATRQLQQDEPDSESSDTIKNRVTRARQRQITRQAKPNNELKAQDIQQYCQLDQQTMEFLETASEKLHLSARAYHRILKLARTIADMQEIDLIKKTHIAEAVGYRSLDRR